MEREIHTDAFAWFQLPGRLPRSREEKKKENTEHKSTSRADDTVAFCRQRACSESNDSLLFRAGALPNEDRRKLVTLHLPRPIPTSPLSFVCFVSPTGYIRWHRPATCLVIVGVRARARAREREREKSLKTSSSRKSRVSAKRHEDNRRNENEVKSNPRV